MPHVAALLGVNQVSDIMSVEGSHTFRRPVYAGNAIVSVEAPDDCKLVATVRVASWQAASGGNAAAIEAVDVAVDLPTHTRYIGLESAASDRPDLQTAAKVVAGGRALGSEEQFDLIYKLADAISTLRSESRVLFSI
jgi:electron transfer flavoprotein alpha subunit